MANNETLLKLTSLNVGESVSGVITGVEQGKFGPVVVLNVNGTTTKVFLAGNVKQFFTTDQSKGLYNNGNLLTITRKEDATLNNGMRVTQYYKTSKKNDSQSVNTPTTAPTTPTTQTNKKAEIQAKLAAARRSA